MENNGADKAFEVPCTSRSFYRLWLSFLTPFHHFTPQVVMIAAELLRHREILSKKVLDERILVKTLLDKEIREQIMADCNVTLSTFRVAVNKLKKGKFLVDGMINKKMIPNLGDSKTFNFMLMFKIND